MCTHLVKLGYNDLRGSSVLQFIRSVVIKASWIFKAKAKVQPSEENNFF